MNNSNIKVTQDNDGWPIKKQEWLESLFALQREHGNEMVRALQTRGRRRNLICKS
jgi:hypothetical protein